MFETKHFVTGNFVSHAAFVDDATYSTILDNVVKATCDVFITRPKMISSADVPDPSRRVQPEDTNEDVEILLGERVGLPHADWWIPGGRVMPGETVDATARRILWRELRLDIGEQPRVRTVAHYTFVWDTRTQEPVHNGTCDVSIILRVDLTREEAACVEFISKEYKQLEWRTLASQAALSTGALHPALAQGVKDLCAMREWEGMNVILDSVSDIDAANVATLQEIVKRVKRFSDLKAA
jgi:hypothetical protein